MSARDKEDAHCLGMLGSMVQRVVGFVYTGNAERTTKAISVIADSQTELQSKMDILRLQILRNKEDAIRLMKAGHVEMARTAMAAAMKMQVQLRKLDAAHTSLQTQIDILDQSETNHMLAKTFKKTAKAMRKAKAPSQEELDRSIAAIEEAGEATEGIADGISISATRSSYATAEDEDVDKALAALMEQATFLEKTEPAPGVMLSKSVGVETDGMLPGAVAVPAGGGKAKSKKQRDREREEKIRQSVLNVVS